MNVTLPRATLQGLLSAGEMFGNGNDKGGSTSYTVTQAVDGWSDNTITRLPKRKLYRHDSNR